MPWMKKLAAIATAAEAARRYAKKNPDQAAKYLDQAAAFVDKQTKGRYTTKIDGISQKVKGVAGVRPTPGPGSGADSAANGQYTAGYSAPQPSATTTPPTAATRPTTPPTTPTTPPTTPTGTPQAGTADKK